MDLVLEKLNKWEKIIVRVLLVSIAVSVLYGVYKYGYQKGVSDAVDYLMQQMSQQPARHHSPMDPSL